MDIHQLTFYEQGKIIRQEELNSVELTRQTLDRIDQRDAKLPVFDSSKSELVLKQSKEFDKFVAASDVKDIENILFLGAPTAIKDLNMVQDMTILYGSHTFCL